MIYLLLLLLLLVGGSVVLMLALVLATRYFICNPVLRATQQIDTLIHQGVTCGRCGNLVKGEAQNHERGDEIFFEVRSEGGTRRVAVGAGSKDKYHPTADRKEEETRVTTRL
jgi:hypothetical protein